ncbi:MAG: HpsJ family protein [Hormoscilla sp.]
MSIVQPDQFSEEQNSPPVEQPPGTSAEPKSPPVEQPPASEDSEDRSSDSTLLGGWFDPNKVPSPHQTQSPTGDKNFLVSLSASASTRSYSLLALVGYGLLILALFDYLQIIYPPNFTNPFWEFQAIGRMVERVPVPLLGLMLVFYRPSGTVDRKSLHLLRFLSWVSLLLGLIYLLSLPLGINNTLRIYKANNAQISAQFVRQNERLQPIKYELEQADTDDEIKEMISAITRQSPLPEIDAPQELKGQLLTQIARAEETMRIQSETVRANRRQALLKNSVKWNLGALVSGTLFIMIWHMTRWARMRSKR